MEKHISQIELINQYIDKQLSATERLNFENQLESNPEFNTIYQEQLIFIEGLKRIQLKAEIASAKRSYIKTKWLKVSGLVIVTLGLLLLCYYLFFNQSNGENQKESFQNEKRIGTETSVKLTDSSKHKFVVIKKITKSIENIEQTNVNGGITIIQDTILIENLGYFSKTEFDSKFPKLAKLKPVNDTLLINETVAYQKTVSEVKSAKGHKENTVSVKEGVVVSKTSKNTSKSLISFYNSVKKAPQIIEINTERETTLTCKEGTVLNIPAKCFIDANGKLARGKVNIEVTEFYKLSDMLLANLTTKSDGNQLETGGMLFIKALKDNKQLQLKPGSNIEYVFSSRGSKKKDMQLFLGEEIKDGVNWTLDNITHKSNAVLTSTEMVLIEEEDVEVPIQYVEEVPVFPGCENGTNAAKKQCFDQALSKLISKNFNTSIAEDLNLMGKHKILTSFKIDKDGEVVDIQVFAAHTLLAKEAIRVLKLIPKLKPGKQRDYTVIVHYSLPINFSLGGSVKNNPNLITVKDKTSFEKKFEERLQNKDSTTTGLVGTVTANDVSRYAFYGSKLGWINCDRFIRSTKNAVKFKLKIKDANGADVKMVFKSLNSILPSRSVGDSYDFGTVTANEAVILVAIKKVDDKLFLGLKEVSTKQITMLDLSFKEVSLDQLKTELRNLNKDFN